MKIALEREIIEDLITYKLRNITGLISNILNRWNETSADSFLKKARNGTYEEAENDAIDLRQLLLEEKKLKENLNHAINQLLVQNKAVKVNKQTKDNFKNLFNFIKNKI